MKISAILILDFYLKFHPNNERIVPFFDPALRQGQAFYQHFGLHKITSKKNKKICDRIFSLSEGDELRSLIQSITDYNN